MSSLRIVRALVELLCGNEHRHPFPCRVRMLAHLPSHFIFHIAVGSSSASVINGDERSARE
eukprot:5068265-Amphidinium_carterae.1